VRGIIIKELVFAVENLSHFIIMSGKIEAIIPTLSFIGSCKIPKYVLWI